MRAGGGRGGDGNVGLGCCCCCCCVGVEDYANEGAEGVEAADDCPAFGQDAQLRQVRRRRHLFRAAGSISEGEAV
jgi:hypothetical protein